MSCGKEVIQMVARGYGYKECKSVCGQTSIYGSQLLCEECMEKLSKKYPQGWDETPGDICRHGNYVGTPGGADYICGACEDGD